MLLRKLILLAFTSAITKLLFDKRRARRLRTPFPTSSRPPQGRRMRRAQSTGA